MAAISAGLAFGLAAPATAASVQCGTPAVEAVYTTVVTPGKPATYSYRKVIDVAYQPAVPGSPAIPAVPPIPAWTEVVTPAVPAQHYSLKGSSKLEKDEVPPTPAAAPDLWQANTEHEPNGHYNATTDDDGTSYVAGESGLHYASHGSKGKRDWFYFQPAVEAVVINHPAVPGKPAVPEVPAKPAVEEVSHVVKELESRAVPPRTKQVLVKEAVPAGPPCTEKPVSPETPETVSKRTAQKSSVPQEQPELAMTGSENGILAAIGASLVGLGLAAYRLRRRA